MKFLDSSIWLAHLLEANEKFSKIIESDSLLFSSILTIFEVRKKLLSEKFDTPKIEDSIDFIKKRSVIVNLDEEIINFAVNVSVKDDLGMTDALIYSSAIKVNAKLITADNDFRGLENVELIEK